MTTTSTADTLPTIFAQSMLYAQAVTLTAEQKATMRRIADAMRALVGNDKPRRLNLQVRDRDGALIGHLVYTA